MKSGIKIAGIGACVMDTLMTVPSYPEEDTKIRALSGKTAGGGPVATGLVAAQKLGEQTAYIGALADDNNGLFLKQDFEKYGVDTGLVEMKKGYRSFTSMVFLAKDTASRTCVFDKGDLPPVALNERQKQAVADACILMIDGNEMEAAKEACRIAKENGTKVLYDGGSLYEGVEHLLKMTDVLIPSAEFALNHTGCSTMEAAAQRLYELYHPEVVVITRGKEGGLFYSGREAKMNRYPAFSVDAVDTNGSGDVFHGAFAAAMVKGYSYRDCCVFASAVSAIKCTGLGARESAPDLKTVNGFLQEKDFLFPETVR